MSLCRMLMALVTGLALGSIRAADLFATAPEYFVDPNIGDDVRYDGRSATVESDTRGPYKTIQMAVDQADGVATVVTLAPGTYDEGLREGPSNNSLSNRVYVTKKNVKIRGTNGHRDDTLIVGVRDYDNDPDNGMGPCAARCVFSSSVNNNVIVEGVTLTGGATFDKDPSGDNGGRGGGAAGVTLVDCVVSNCAAYRGGGLLASNAFRTRIVENYATNLGAGGISSSYSNCLIARNRGAAAVSYVTTMVNCTVTDNFDNYAFYAITAGQKFYNCVFAGNRLGNGYSKVSQAAGSTLYATIVESPGFFESAEANAQTNIAPRAQLVGPGIGDYRLLSTATAVGLGDATYLTELPFPEGCVPCDLDGNVLPTTGTLNAGCFQTTVTAVGAPFVCYSGELEIDGLGVLVANGYFWPTEREKTYRIRPVLADPKTFYGLYDNVLGVSQSMNVPLYDGWCRYRVNLDGSFAERRIRAMSASAVYYVDAENGDDACDGTAASRVGDSLAGPKRTLAAVTEIDGIGETSNLTIIYVAPGAYSNGVSSANARSRVTVPKNTALVSTVRGAARIYGRLSAENADGRGSDAMRCVNMTGNDCYLKGLVLTDGRSAKDVAEAYRGSGVYCNATLREYIIDCVITNCGASSVGCTYRGRAIRTAFYDNFAQVGPLVWKTTCHNCTFYGNRVSEEAGLFSGETSLYLCSVDAGGQRLFESSADSVMVGTLADRVSSTLEPATQSGSLVNGAICFAEPPAHDFRLGNLSDANDLADVSSLTNVETFTFLQSDFLGNDLRIDTAGKLTAGAVHQSESLPCVIITASGSLATTVEGGVVGTNVVNRADRQLVIRADANRPFIRIREGDRPVSTMAPYVIPLSEVLVNTSYSVDYGDTWYIAKDGNDANGGGTAATPLEHIQTAAARALAGDTILVAPGVYGEEGGTMLPTEPIVKSPTTVPCRVWVKPGVTLASSGGATQTSIVGRMSDDPGQYGTGSGAVRCVALSANATVKGFLITGGATAFSESASYTDNTVGAGVIGSSVDTSVVADCIISNNHAACSAAGFRCRFLRSQIVENLATARAAAVREGRFVGCFIDRNCGSNPIEHYWEFDSCTVGPGNTNFNGQSDNVLLYPRDGTVLKNSVVLQEKSVYNGKTEGYPAVARNCVFIKGSGPTASTWDVDERTKFLLEPADARLDGACRPIVGASADERSPLVDAVDAASDALSDAAAVGETDASGLPRVMNGVRDIGAFEGDWRTKFARDIALSSRFEIVAVTAGVIEESTTGRVHLLPEASLTGRWTLRAPGDTTRLVVQVSGSGTLTVSRNGAVVRTLAADDGRQELVFTTSGLTDSFQLAYAGDDGSAEVFRAKDETGLQLLVK